MFLSRKHCFLVTNCAFFAALQTYFQNGIKFIFRNTYCKNRTFCAKLQLKNTFILGGLYEYLARHLSRQNQV